MADKAVPGSLRRHLLLGILIPVGLVMLIDTVVFYRQALAAVNTAYDRTLLASAKSIGELLTVDGDGPLARFQANVPYSALEAFEADNRSRMVYRVSDTRGQLVDGAGDLRIWSGKLPDQGPYAALVDFYDDSYRGDAVRVAVLLQPVASVTGRGVATIQVAETLELRHTLARRMLIDTLWRQALLAIVVALLVVIVVQRATRPVRKLSELVRSRDEGDLTTIVAPAIPRELRPLLDATNQLMARLQRLLEHQKRFVRDASHQLRTPLAVLKTQVQSAQRGDVEPMQALQEMGGTVDRATSLANQMLALAKVEQVRGQSGTRVVDWSEIVRAVALDLSPLIAQKDLDFSIASVPAPITGHDWMLRELSRNLLHNAIKHAPHGSALSVSVQAQDGQATLRVSDAGPGITPELRTRLFQPFAAGNSHSGSGLGLTICLEISQAMQGRIELVNRVIGDGVAGLDAVVRLPLAGTTTGAYGQSSD